MDEKTPHEIARANEMEDLRAEVRLCRDDLNARLSATVHALGGIVEGNPTGQHNYLQRIRELRAIELQKDQMERRLSQAVNSRCSCGGMGPGTCGCDYCALYHFVMGNTEKRNCECKPGAALCDSCITGQTETRKRSCGVPFGEGNHCAFLKPCPEHDGPVCSCKVPGSDCKRHPL